MSNAFQLAPEHQALINASRISEEVAQARGYRTVRLKAELERLGFSKPQRLPGLLIPIRGVTGEIVTHQLRPDEPRFVGGKPLKYETPKGSRMALDVPPSAHQWLDEPARPLFITEGARKADAGVSAGLCTVALLGVWNWRGTNEHGGKTALADWESIALAGREVYIVFDSDVMTKDPVRLALTRLKGFLELRDARARVIYLPCGDGGSKVGLDDFLASGKTSAELLVLATDDLRDLSTLNAESAYAVTEDGRTIFRKPLREGGTVDVQLANFSAMIVREVIEDDGAETRSVFGIEARLGGRRATFEVPAERFAALHWPIEHLGPKATVSAGFGSKERLREAIQNLSRSEIPQERTYAHTGFRQVGEELVYLHAGGGIGPRGPVAGIAVRLQPPLDLFRLEPLADDRECLAAVKLSLGILNGLASDGTVFPLFSALYLAPLGDTNVSLHVAGKTGRRKTEIVALVQRHFGASMDAEHLPGSWTSTPNALEAAAFHAKDAILVVDDFNPIGSVQDVRRTHASADRLLRAQGNRSGRQRMRPDGSLRTPKPPRGLIISTGEDVPAGHSLRARMIVIEIGENEVNLGRLTQCQRDAARYPSAMAGYVRWVAGRRDVLREERRAFVEEQRRGLSGMPHGRTTTAGALLLFGLKCALRFAHEIGAISISDEGSLLKRGHRALLGVLVSQCEHHEASDPVKAFAEVLAASLQSGSAHLADAAHGGAPDSNDNEVDSGLAHLVGWRLAVSDSGEGERREWRPGGTLVGWVDRNTNSVYLIPQAAYEAAQRMAASSPERITLGQRMLARALDEAGVLASKDAGEGRRTKKVRIAGQPRSVWHVGLAFLFEAAGTGGTGGTAPPGDQAKCSLFPEDVPTACPGGEASGTPSGNDPSIPERDAGEDTAVPTVPGMAGTDGDEYEREERAAIQGLGCWLARDQSETHPGSDWRSRDPEASDSVGDQ